MPSKRHLWKYLGHSERAGTIEHCERCGSHFLEKADTRGTVYCYPTPTWLKAHPNDDGLTGP